MAGLFTFSASVFKDKDELKKASTEIKIKGETLTISTPGTEEIVLGVQATFQFTASNIPSTIQNIQFEWVFGDDKANDNTGKSLVIPVTSGQLMTSTSFTYNSEGILTSTYIMTH